jgi:hypothetical protein
MSNTVSRGEGTYIDDDLDWSPNLSSDDGLESLEEYSDGEQELRVEDEDWEIAERGLFVSGVCGKELEVDFRFYKTL